MLRTPFPTKPTQIQEIISNPLSFLELGKFPIREKNTIWPYPFYDADTYYGKDNFEVAEHIIFNNNLSDDEKFRQLRDLSKRIWLKDKLTGGRLNATGGRDPNKHRRLLDFDVMIRKCHDTCDDCGAILNYFMKFNRWYFEKLYPECERPSLERIMSDAIYTNTNTMIKCLSCNVNDSDNDEDIKYYK